MTRERLVFERVNEGACPHRPGTLDCGEQRREPDHTQRDLVERAYVLF